MELLVLDLDMTLLNTHLPGQVSIEMRKTDVNKFIDKYVKRVRPEFLRYIETLKIPVAIATFNDNKEVASIVSIAFTEANLDPPVYVAQNKRGGNKNEHLQEIQSKTNIDFSRTKTEICDFEYEYTVGDCLKKKIYIKSSDKNKVLDWVSKGFTEFMRTPSETIIFVSPEEKHQITKDQIECMGCLSHCKFSNWKDHDNFTTGASPDPRSFCIQKTLQNAVSSDNIENELMFSGHNGFRFKRDPYYQNGFIPTIEELVKRILEEPYL